MKKVFKGAHVKSIKRKNKQSKKVDIPTKFWNEYSELDYFERREKINFITEHIISYNKVLKDKKIKEHAVASLLQDYFDDIIEVFKK